MDGKRQVRVSKYLSLHLRHQPEELGLSLEPGGWVKVDDLLAACAGRGFPITRDELAQVVKGSDKQRFAFDESGTRIRANQGHSVNVELDHPRREPPELLFHGTVARALRSIRASGLVRGRRHHVHLSASREQAAIVGGRRGAPVVLEVLAGRMHVAGHVFLLSPNGVWLTERVPPEFLRIPD